MKKLENKIKFFIIKSRMINDINRLKLEKRNILVKKTLGEKYNILDPWGEEVWDYNKN